MLNPKNDLLLNSFTNVLQIIAVASLILTATVMLFAYLDPLKNQAYSRDTIRERHLQQLTKLIRNSYLEDRLSLQEISLSEVRPTTLTTSWSSDSTQASQQLAQQIGTGDNNCQLKTQYCNVTVSNCLFPNKKDKSEFWPVDISFGNIEQSGFVIEKITSDQKSSIASASAPVTLTPTTINTNQKITTNQNTEESAETPTDDYRITACYAESRPISIIISLPRKHPIKETTNETSEDKKAKE